MQLTALFNSLFLNYSIALYTHVHEFVYFTYHTAGFKDTFLPI